MFRRSRRQFVSSRGFAFRWCACRARGLAAASEYGGPRLLAEAGRGCPLWTAAALRRFAFPQAAHLRALNPEEPGSEPLGSLGLRRIRRAGARVYSDLSACITSTRAARAAGHDDAATAATSRTIAESTT